MGLALLLALAMRATAALLPSPVIGLPWHEVLGIAVFAIGILFIVAAGLGFRRQSLSSARRSQKVGSPELEIR